MLAKWWCWPFALKDEAMASWRGESSDATRADGTSDERPKGDDEEERK